MKKNGRLLLIAMAGALIGGTSFFIRPELHPVVKYFLLALAALVLLVFYFLTIRQVIRKGNFNASEKIFWTIVILCVPLIGNVVYLVINGLANGPQVLKHTW